MGSFDGPDCVQSTHLPNLHIHINCLQNGKLVLFTLTLNRRVIDEGSINRHVITRTCQLRQVEYMRAAASSERAPCSSVKGFASRQRLLPHVTTTLGLRGSDDLLFSHL